jgi:multicomponent Na+:H+ antiporter subunit D
VLLCLTGAGLALVFQRHPRAQRAIAMTTLILMVLVAALLLVLSDRGAIVAVIGNWAAPVGIALVADRLSALMLLISSIVLVCVLWYAMAQGIGDGSNIGRSEAERQDLLPVAIYHPTFLILAAGVANAFLAGDLFNLYVGFEVLLAASYVLLTIGGTRDRIRAGSIYVVVALVSSLVFLAAVSMIYAATGTLNLAHLALRLPDIDPSVRLGLQLMLLLAFGIKAAIFPLSAWLPDSYPTAPAPVTAVFAGLLTKVGVYSIIRTQTLLFPSPDVGSVWVDRLLLVLALFTMVVGILGAVAQDDIKRLLSFTLVSHIGYMVFAISLADGQGAENLGATAAAIFYVIHHITVQTALFLVVGLVERRGGSTSLDRLGGLAKLAPGIAVLFFLPAMNLAGIPPLSGFLGKVGIITAGAQVGHPLAWVLVVGSVVTSLLTLYALVKAWNKAFWQDAPDDVLVEKAGDKAPRGMYAAATALVTVSLALTVFAGPVHNYAGRAATGLIDGRSYVEAVFPGGTENADDTGVRDQEVADDDGFDEEVHQGAGVKGTGAQGADHG